MREEYCKLLQHVCAAETNMPGESPIMESEALGPGGAALTAIRKSRVSYRPMKHMLLSAATASIVFGVLAVWRTVLTPSLRRIAVAGMTLLLVVAVRPLVVMVASALRTPPMWDLRCFWVWGRVALGTHAVYDPVSSLMFAPMFPYDAGWFKEFLVVGFIYPPPTILLFAPLGFLKSPALAAPYWYAVELLALCAAVVVLWRTFFKKYGLPGLLAIAILVFVFRATAATFMYGQPLPIMLFLLALFVADASASRRGVWLGLAFIVKPMAIVFFLAPLLRRSWNELGTGALTILAGFAGAVELVSICGGIPEAG